MPQKSSQDRYANKFYGAVTESGANTLTFAEINTAINLQSRTAWILHRLEWYLDNASIAIVSATGDTIHGALCSSNKMTQLGLDNAGVIDLFDLTEINATGVGFSQYFYPLMRDFNQLPGGGLIIPPRPLYVAAMGVALAAAVTVKVRGYYTSLELADSDYYDLLDAYRILS